MSRSGYTDDYDGDAQWAMIRWRGAVESAINGKRGQAFLKELAASLDAMPVKELIPHELVSVEGCCALGSVAIARNMSVAGIDVDDYDKVAETFGIAPAMAREIEYVNDDGYWENDAERWRWVRRWVAENIKETIEKERQ